MFLTVIIFVLVLGLLILVHELGHFLVARREGVKVEEFGLGFPPRLWGKKIKDTIYSLNWIPIGGFVRLFGEDGSHAKADSSYSHKSVYSRSKIVAAGVIMNFLLGFVIYILYFALGNPPVTFDPAKYVPDNKIEYKTMVLDVKDGSAAAEIGIKPRDFIYQIDNQEISKVNQLIDYVDKKAGKKVLVFFGPNGATETKEVKIDSDNGKGKLGVVISQAYGKVQYKWWQIPIIALEETARLIGLIFYYLYMIIARLVSEGKVEEGVVGPVGIFMLTNQIVKLGFSPLIRFIAFLSVNLGVVNLLPVPALDGGQLIILLFEKLRGKKIRQSVESALQLVGFAILILIIILITYRDVVRLF